MVDSKDKDDKKKPEEGEEKKDFMDRAFGRLWEDGRKKDDKGGDK